jgi:hypothetical protein
VSTFLNRAAATALALAGTAPPTGAVMIDNFVNGAEFGFELASATAATCTSTTRDSGTDHV